jgi:hypothetical protein
MENRLEPDTSDVVDSEAPADDEGERTELSTAPFEANEADVLEQEQEVDYADDDYR